ncbi:ero1-like protein isoform X2 [Macrobrachium nipponense]|uniref:ero1-like protein isoform X2 n=1 Tax=Macrobrachium nipponense TaxID=159736 RepID=UPI0030C8767C
MKWFNVTLCGVFVAFCAGTCGGQWFGAQKSSRTSKGGSPAAGERCFCQLKGVIDDCSCSVETLNSFNNLKVFPRLNSLLSQNFFRYWKVNLNKECPFWEDDSKCAIRFCSVQPCTNMSELSRNCKESEVPEVPDGIKGSVTYLEKNKIEKQKYYNTNDCGGENDLGYLNTTLSKESIDGFERWAAHDSAIDSFCELDDESSTDSDYVDLLLNPERYTGYAGPSAHRVWRSIYQENCFKPSADLGPYADFSSIGDMCLEKRTFYRAVSGLHSSINIHLCAQYLLSDKEGFTDSSEGVWGPNIEEFQRRFDPELTGGEGPLRLKNLYFVYLLEMKALAKAAPYLESLEFYTGNEEEDIDVRKAVMDLLNVIQGFPNHFDEGAMFAGGFQAAKLKEEFKQHFRNISRIMDCVGCDKCRLWGKLQITGLGTALKILFSGNFDQPLDQQLSLSTVRLTKFQLSRGEIVSLFNAFGRLSRSIMELERFQEEILR